SHADLAEFLIVMAITNPDVPVHQGASMFLVPRDVPGLRFLRMAGLGGEPLGHGHHPHLRYQGVPVPAENLLGRHGQPLTLPATPPSATGACAPPPRTCSAARARRSRSRRRGSAAGASTMRCAPSRW